MPDNDDTLSQFINDDFSNYLRHLREHIRSYTEMTSGMDPYSRSVLAKYSKPAPKKIKRNLPEWW